MSRIPIFAAAILWAASAAAHPAEECRTTLANFADRAAAFEESAEVAQPILERLFAAYDEAMRADSHAHRHAVLYRHFVAEFPRLRPHLSAEVPSQALQWARKAIFCLKRDLDR